MGTVLSSAIRKIASALLVTALSTLVMQASAATIVYIHTGHGTGTLNGEAFEADFGIYAIGDTNNVTECGVGCLQNLNLAATITIDVDGIGLLNFLTPTSYVLTGDQISFTANGAKLISGPLSPLLSGWDLRSSVGLIPGNAQLANWSLGSVLTTGGVLTFDDGVVTTPSGFSALVSEVPVPAGIWLFGSGLVGLVGIARRKA